jgi:protein-disulfide isomerase
MYKKATVSLLILLLLFAGIPNRFVVLKAEDSDTTNALQIYGLEMELYRTRLKVEKQTLLKGLIAREAAKAGMTATEWEKLFFEANDPDLDSDRIKRLLKKGEEVDFDKAKKIFLENYRAQLREKLWQDLSRKYGVKTKTRPPAVPEIKISVENRRSIGSADAAIRVVEFYDLECPFCKKANAINQKIRREFADKLHWTVFDFPAEKKHRNALSGHIAVECAGAQNNFFPYRDGLFQAEKLDNDTIIAVAKNQGLDISIFKKCLKEQDEPGTAKVRTAAEYAKKLGVAGTPTLFINNRPYPGLRSYEEMRKVFREILAAEKKKSAKTSSPLKI